MVEKFDNEDAKNGNFINQMEFRKKSSKGSLLEKEWICIYTERDSKVGIWAEAKALAVKQSQKGPYY